MLVRDFLQPAPVFADDATISDAAAALARTGVAYVQVRAAWQAVRPSAVVGYPTSRRLIDVPLESATPIDIDAGIDEVIGPARASDLFLVTERGAIAGCVDRRAVLGTLASETSPAQLGVLLLTRMIPALVHDLSNSLLVVRATVQLARLRDKVDDLGDVDVAVTHAIGLLQRVRDLAAGVDEDAPGPVDVNAVIGTLQPMLASALGAAIELVLDLDPTTPVALVYPRALERSVLNLVVNARDAMSDGGIVRIATAATSAGEVEIVIEDNGAGIAPEIAARLFQAGASSRGPGRGLGLTGVSQALHRVGGRVALTPSSLGGAGFRITLPAATG